MGKAKKKRQQQSCKMMQAIDMIEEAAFDGNENLSRCYAYN